MLLHVELYLTENFNYLPKSNESWSPFNGSLTSTEPREVRPPAPHSPRHAIVQFIVNVVVRLESNVRSYKLYDKVVILGHVLNRGLREREVERRGLEGDGGRERERGGMI